MKELADYATAITEWRTQLPLDFTARPKPPRIVVLGPPGTSVAYTTQSVELTLTTQLYSTAQTTSSHTLTHYMCMCSAAGFRHGEDTRKPNYHRLAGKKRTSSEAIRLHWSGRPAARHRRNHPHRTSCVHEESTRQTIQRRPLTVGPGDA